MRHTSDATTSIRFNQEDRRVIAELKKRTGLLSAAEIVRYALRIAQGAAQLAVAECSVDAQKQVK